MTDEPETTDPQPSEDEFDAKAALAMDERVWAILQDKDATPAAIREARQWLKERRQQGDAEEDPQQRAIREQYEARQAGGELPEVDAEGEDETSRAT